MNATCTLGRIRVASRRAPIHGFICLLTFLVFWAGCGRRPGEGQPAAEEADFGVLMNVGKNYYDKGEALRAIEPFKQALALDPANADAHLNLANAYLLTDQPTNALFHAAQVLAIDPNAEAAWFVKGCAHLRLRQFEEAVKALQTSKDIDPRIGAVTFQLGRAHQELGQWDAAASAFEELVQFEPDHPAAHYALGQVLLRLGRQSEAAAALELHQKILADRKAQNQPPLDQADLERCAHTESRAPFIVEQPDPSGIPVTFADVTAQVLENAEQFTGPLGTIDYDLTGWSSLFVAEAGQGFRLLANSNGVFRPLGPALPGIEGARYSRCLVGDLQNDRIEDVLVLGDQGSHLFRFATNAQILDSSRFSRLLGLEAVDGALVDLDFTSRLDLVAVLPEGQGVRVMRNLGGLMFQDITATSGVPAVVTGAAGLAIDDWDNNDLLDVVVAQPGQPPLLLLKQRGGPLAPTNTPANWPAGSAVAFGDFNNDLRADLVVATGDHLECLWNGLNDRVVVPDVAPAPARLFPLDYDNDGWLDLAAVGQGLRLWRNLGRDGFRETTSAVGLDKVLSGRIDSIAAADFDIDGDTDLALSVEGQGVKILRNEGANANLQLKVRLIGNKSNASGIGTRVEVTAGGLRLGRRVMTLPVEIGVGQHRKLESLNARWLNLSMNNVDVEVDPRTQIPMMELFIMEGSCPYLYVWDGGQFRFVTDILSASPLGLPLSAQRFVEADPDEYVWVGDESRLEPRGDHYVFQVTEELCEVLYLDAAQLVVVDYPPGTEIYPTGKMVPGRPFPPQDLVALGWPRPLHHAERNDGLEVTEALRHADNVPVSPIKLRIPQLRGMAEPWHVTLDFGPLPVERPLVLGITAWLQFGSGTVNMAASLDPSLPFPFPSLDVEVGGEWRPVDVVVGTPAGKTKNLIVDLDGKLPPGSRRLRLRTAYQLHWDRVALLEKAPDAELRVTRIDPAVADLHWHGFGEIEDWSWELPLTPSYDRVQHQPAWHITPMGWCTRYGDVLELVTARDNALALVNGGDELTLEFPVRSLPQKPAGAQRGFFFFSSGWDKDSNFHCEKGWLVEPLPWHGLDDQLYGTQPRPAFDNDDWIQKYNTRWVGQRTLARVGRE